MPTSEFLYEDDDELTHRLVYIGALSWPVLVNGEGKGVRLCSSEKLDEIAALYGLSRHQRKNPEYVLLYRPELDLF